MVDVCADTNGESDMSSSSEGSDSYVQYMKSFAVGDNSKGKIAFSGTSTNEAIVGLAVSCDSLRHWHLLIVGADYSLL
jgi:hypothetical protein